MKIAHVADSHFQKKRLDECIRCFSFISDYLVKEKPDYIFHAGDLFEKNVLINSPEYLAAVNAMISLANIAPVYMVRGNHDPVGALEIFQELRTKFSIYYFDEISTIVASDFRFLAIPYQIASHLGSGDSVGEIHKSGAEVIRDHIDKFIKERNVEVPSFILAHISVMDSQFANSERIVEGEIILPVEDFDRKEIDGVFLGHIHRNQQDIFEGTRIRYAGAHYRTRFDEMLEPGFCMWEFGSQTDIKFIPTPSREMIQINLDEEETKKLIVSGEYKFPEGADVKIVLEVAQGLNKIINTEDIMGLVPEGTVLDIAIKVNPVTEVRSKKMSEGLTNMEKLVEWGVISEIEITSNLKKKFDEIINHDRGVYV